MMPLGAFRWDLGDGSGVLADAKITSWGADYGGQAPGRSFASGNPGEGWPLAWGPILR